MDQDPGLTPPDSYGPGSNGHGPGESLHLPTAGRVTASLAILFDAHARGPSA